MNLYSKVKAACLENEISVACLEKELNFPRSAIQKWDINIPSVKKVYQVAKRLNKPIEYFVNEEW